MRVLLFGDPTRWVPQQMAKLRKLADVHFIPRTTAAEVPINITKAIKEHGPFDAFCTTWHMKEFMPFSFNKTTLGPLAPHCKLYVDLKAGYDTVDVEWIQSTGATFANVPREISRGTGQGAITLLLSVLRGASHQERHAREGKWIDWEVQTFDWGTITVGVIGIGNIGAEVARGLTGLGIRTIYHARNKRDVPYEHVSLDELYRRSDAVVLACPMTDDTRGMINKHSLEKMKDGSVLINVARGGLINEDELVDALNSGKIMRAGLDAFPDEPNINPKLLAHPNITITPHCIAGHDVAGLHSLGEGIDNLIAFAETGQPLTPIRCPARRVSSAN